MGFGVVGNLVVGIREIRVVGNLVVGNLVVGIREIRVVGLTVVGASINLCRVNNKLLQ